MGLWVEGTQTEENIYGLAILFLVTLCLFINDRTLEATIPMQSENPVDIHIFQNKHLKVSLEINTQMPRRTSRPMEYQPAHNFCS
jgi:hypothetical protein